LRHGFRAARQVHDERSSASDGYAPGEGSVRRVAKPVRDERRWDSWHVALRDVARCLWGYVSCAQARASGRQDDIAKSVVGPDLEVFGDEGTVIGDEVPAQDDVARLLGHAHDEVAALVRAFTGRAFIGTRKDADASHAWIVDWPKGNVDGCRSAGQAAQCERRTFDARVDGYATASEVVAHLIDDCAVLAVIGFGWTEDHGYGLA
jgi:hypothetical protein